VLPAGAVDWWRLLSAVRHRRSWLIFQIGVVLHGECSRVPASNCERIDVRHPDWLKNAAARRAMSSAGTFSIRWLSIHCCPNGSRSRATRSP
jgi:hypothetical protein